MLSQGLSKLEIIRDRREIERLFNKGKKLAEFPVLAFYFRNPESTSAYPRVFFSVPKRNIRKATKRNLLRRRMKEAYRMNKDILHASASSRELEIVLLYIGREEASFSDIQEKIIVLLKRLVNPNEKAAE